jgi:hypothetical protein
MIHSQSGFGTTSRALASDQLKFTVQAKGSSQRGSEGRGALPAVGDSEGAFRLGNLEVRGRGDPREG